MASEPSFLCTFCWTLQFRPAKPKVLGGEARIACETCWKSVLDLSICWLCGEIVVRGEEVVSLGWCFWHRGCFGCLICGTDLDPPLNNEDGNDELHWTDGDNFEKGASAGSEYLERFERGRTRRQRGVELVRIPLCSWCDNVTDSIHNAQMLEIGLKSATKKDGGLSRLRFDMLEEMKSEDVARLQPKTWDSTEGQKQFENNEHESDAGESLLVGAGGVGMGEDGNTDGMVSRCSPAESINSIPSPIYVSVLDPIGEPSFRASKTKPLPRWMALLPSNRRETFEQECTAEQSPKAQASARRLTSAITEAPSDSYTVLERPATVLGPKSYDEMSGVDNNITGYNIKDVTTSSDCRTPRPQRNDTTHPSKRSVYRAPLSLSIEKLSLPCQVEATTMLANGDFFSALESQTTSTLVSTHRRSKKRDISREEEPAVGGFKRQKTEELVLTAEEKNESSECAQQGAPEHVDRRDELRRELMGLFRGRKQPSHE